MGLIHTLEPIAHFTTIWFINARPLPSEMHTADCQHLAVVIVPPSNYKPNF